jgi:small subunit ribosomal protein S20
VANIKSQIKRNRQNERKGMRNKAIRSALKSTAKRVRSADGESASEQLRLAARQIDKAVAKGALHKRTAARRKSRLARAIGSRTESG